MPVLIVVCSQHRKKCRLGGPDDRHIVHLAGDACGGQRFTIRRESIVDRENTFAELAAHKAEERAQ